jgi:hypothetical protein
MFGGRHGPGRRSLAGKLGTVDARAATLGGRHCWWRVGIEAAVGTQADQNGNGELLQPLGHLGRVVARIKDEQRYRPVRRRSADDSRDLRDRHGIGVLTRMHPSHIKRGGPAIAREVELSQPLVRPARDDRLPGGVAGGMVIKAAVWARLGIATGPDAQINSVDRLILRRRVPRQQCAEGRDVQVTLGQGRVETAPAAAVFGLQAEVGQGGYRFGCQQGVTKLEEGIGTSDKAVMQGTSEGAEGLEVMSGHGAQRARWPRRWPTRPTTAPPWVKSQAKSVL